NRGKTVHRQQTYPADYPTRASSPLICFGGPTTWRCELPEASAKILARLRDLPAEIGSSDLHEAA
ncbi:MAG: hypothetical protein DME98_07700, partial [Verrucomicrobia bacterium]